MVADILWQRVIGCSLLALLLTGCGGARTEAVLEVSSVLPPAASITPTATTTSLVAVVVSPTDTSQAADQEGLLRITSPLATTEVSGGDDLRIALYLVDQDDLPVEGAAVQVELWAPGGELLVVLPCADQGHGRYLAEYVSLPLRGAGGAWQVVGRAAWGDGQQTEAERTFQVSTSLSETYQERYGFWIVLPRIYGLGTGFYNLHESGGFHFEDWSNEDGSGYVILDNYRYGAAGITFATLEVYWKLVDFPIDEVAAIVHAQNLAETGLHHQEPNTSVMNPVAKAVTFQDQPAWQVIGWWKEYYTAKAAPERPAEWLIFPCPGSDWLWSLAISTNYVVHMRNLRALQETFECPSALE